MKIYVKNQTFVIMCALAFTLLSIAGGGEAWSREKVKTFETLGACAVNRGDGDAAKKEAVRNALTAAVARMTAELLPRETVIKNFSLLGSEIYEKHDDFIQQYRILEETASKDSFMVMISASVLGDKIYKRILQAGIIASKSRQSAILFVLKKYRQAGQGRPRTEMAPKNDKLRVVLEEMLTAENLTVMTYPDDALSFLISSELNDFNREKLFETGKYMAADIAVLARVTAGPVLKSVYKNIRTYKGVSNISAIDLKTGKPLADTSAEKVVAASDERTGMDNAALLAGKKAMRKLAGVVAGGRNSSAPVKITVYGADNLSNFVLFREALQNLPEVKGVQLAAMARGSRTLLADSTVEAGELAKALMLKNFDRFRLSISESGNESLAIRLLIR